VVGMEFYFFNVVFTDGLIDFEGWGFGQIVGITIWLSVSTKVRYLEFSQSYHSFLSNVETTNSVRWVGKRNAMALPTVSIVLIKITIHGKYLDVLSKKVPMRANKVCGHQK
jgi:hypothetical protein